jgi:hypothetical protein
MTCSEILAVLLAAVAGEHVGVERVPSDRAPTPVDHAKRRHSASRCRCRAHHSSSAEFRSVFCQQKPPLLPDAEQPKGEQNPLRRQNGA